MLKYWRIWLLIIMVFGSVLAIGLKAYPYGRNVVEIMYVSEDSPASGVLSQGMFISEVDGAMVSSVEEWNDKTKGLKHRVTLTVNGKKFEFEINESLGIDVMEIERTNLDFGLDLRGGTRIIMKPTGNVTSEDITQVIATLQTRANIYGLREMKFYSITGVDGSSYIQIEAAGVGREIVDELLSKQGRFEAKIFKPVEISNLTGNLVVGQDSIPVSVIENTSNIQISDRILEPNDTIEISEISFEYINTTLDRAVFLAKVYEGDDIELVYSDPQHSGVRPQGGGFSFYFVVLVSEEGARRFADVTTGIPSFVDMQSGERYLDSRILLYLDDQLVSDLRIASELGGRIYNTPQIQGWRQDQDDANLEKLRLQTILRSGALPTTLEIASADVISPNLGEEFFASAGIAAVFAGMAVVAVVFIRYRKLKVAIPLVFIGMAEVLIILGIAATNDVAIWGSILVINFLLISTAWWKKHEIDVYAWIGAILIPILGLMSWTIDLPAIGGIIAAIGTGVDHQIIIADETLTGRTEKRIYTMKDKIRRAFFIIFGAAATTIAAMIPLMSIGVGLVRGFAITTIVGVLVGIMITRPAYARIVELTSKD